MRVLTEASVPCRSPTGAVMGYVTLIPMKDAESPAAAPLIEVSAEEACRHRETVIQLRESERYEYEIDCGAGVDLRLRCSLSSRRRALGTGNHRPDAGIIETRSFCGTLLLELVEGKADDSKTAVASALLDVRSLKLDYRTQYRGMLRRLSDVLAGLVADARSSAKVGFRSTFEERTDTGWLQIQLELLREALDGAEFTAAMQRILNFPHERLCSVSDSITTNRTIRWTPSAVRQLITRTPRREVPIHHQLRTQLELESLAQRVLVSRKSRDLDTPETRFVKFALGEFRTFLTHAQVVFESSAGWGASAAVSQRLAVTVDDWLGRGLFREVGDIRLAPLGSPTLQRKAGYREVLRWWLRFRTAAELSWEGGEELFHAGQRDMATLYEYWLFFELLEWFCKKCRAGSAPAIGELIEGLEEGSPNLRLRKRIELGPFAGTFAGQSRRLNARFAYNRCFEVTPDRHLGGSWTRRLHPDYTLTFWPEDLSEAEAERQELLVHVHFDAKYRVEHIDSLFGAVGANDVDDEVEGNYNRQDLLKMHAYRDAIKRSQGAYVLYPGRSGAVDNLNCFHEILPGLGAFGVVPDENGVAQGMESLERFLDAVLLHLGNRTTAQERVSYHIAESYKANQESVAYGSLVLAERDEIHGAERAQPPAEHFVVVAGFDSDSQLHWCQNKGLAFVRIGSLGDEWQVSAEFASARHLLLRTASGALITGLFTLKGRKPLYKVYTVDQLRSMGYPNVDQGGVYAVLHMEADPAFHEQQWDAAKLPPNAQGLASGPSVVSLQNLLRAMS